MFRLNQAPNEVLSAISSEKASRGCGMFWAITCCIPSFGASIGCCDRREDHYNGWYPKDVPADTPVTLNVLAEKMREIKISKDRLAELSQGDPCFDIRKQIEWQVKTTLKVLRRAVADGHIQGSYLDRLTRTLNDLTTKANTEELYGVLVDDEKAPLTASQPYAPNYGMGSKK